MSNQTIKCKVDSCKYNESASMCALNDIEVGCDGSMEAHDKCDTKCNSFEEK